MHVDLGSTAAVVRWRYRSALLDALRSRGIEFVDLSETLAAEARAAGGIEPPYGASHFSARGNALVARAIAEQLARE